MATKQLERDQRDRKEDPDRAPKGKRDPAKIAKMNARFRQSVAQESAGIWSKDEQEFLIRHFESLQSEEERKDLYWNKLSMLVAGAKNHIETFRRRIAEAKQDPWTCAVREAEMIERTAMHPWKERQKVLENYERYKQIGIEQSKVFRTICAAARQEGLLAEGDEHVFTERYLEAFYEDGAENRITIITKLKAFIEHHRQSMGETTDDLEGLDRKQFSPEDIAWFKNDFTKANAEGRRWRRKNFDKWVLAWQDKREKRGQKWIADMRAVPVEHLSAREREKRIKDFYEKDSDGRREDIVHFDEYRGMGERNYQTHDAGVQMRVTDGRMDKETARSRRAEFLDADWDRRLVMVQELDSSDGQVSSSTESAHGTYFSKRFEELMEEIIQEKQGMIQYFREKEAAAKETDEIDVAAVTITTPQEAPVQEMHYAETQPESIEVENADSQVQELPDNLVQFRPRGERVVSSDVETPAVQSVEQEAQPAAQPEEGIEQKLETSGAQLLVFDPLQKKLKNPGSLTNFTSRLFKSIYHAMVDPRGSTSVYEVTKRLAEKRSRDEAPREELDRLDKVA